MATEINKYRDIQLRARNLRDSEGAHSAIDYVKSALDEACGQELRGLLLSDLAKLYWSQDRLDEAEAVLRQAIEEQPADPLRWKQLASHNQNMRRDLNKAAEYIQTALEMAEKSNTLIRHVLAHRIDIALDRGDFEAVESSIEKMLASPSGHGVRDVRFEDWFLERIPPAKVDRNLLRKYREVLQKVRDVPPQKGDELP